MRLKKYQLLLFIINLFSLFFILQIEFRTFELFKSNFNIYTANKINSLTVNIAVGVIVSTIFYIIVVAYPNYLKKKSTYNIIQPRINTIGNQLHHSINYFIEKKINQEHERINKLKFNDFKGIEKLTNEKMNLRYKVKGTHGDWIPFSSGEQTEIKFFIHHKKILSKKIDEIFSQPTITSIDDELIEALSKLKDSWFFSGIESFSKYGEKVTVNEFNKGVFDYYTYYITIKKFAKIHQFKVVN